MLILTLTLSLLLLGLGWRFGLAALAQIAKLRLRAPYLPACACIAQFVGVVTQQHRLALVCISAVLLAGFCLLNRASAGMWLITIGIALNMLVMGLNGGMMPIHPETIARMGRPAVEVGTSFARNRVLEDEQAKGAWLSDRLLLPGSLAGLAAWSIGDVLILYGVSRLLVRTVASHGYS